MKKSRVISPKYEEALRWDAKNYRKQNYQMKKLTNITKNLLSKKKNQY